MYDVHPRNMMVLVLALMLAIFRPAGADTASRSHDAHAQRSVRELKLDKLARNHEHFDTFLAALESAGLEGKLSGRNHYTMFMPNDLAFKRLPSGVQHALFAPDNRQLLAETLRNHMLSGDQHAAAIAKRQAVRTLGGERLKIGAVAGTPVHFGPANVLSSEQAAANGVLYELDTVLIPRRVSEALQRQGYVLTASVPD